MKWEYKMVYLGFEPLPDEKLYESRLHAGVHALNELGGEGWELVQFLEHQLSKEVFKCHAVFKRARAD